jgi:hypothetical protein
MIMILEKKQKSQKHKYFKCGPYCQQDVECARENGL